MAGEHPPPAATVAPRSVPTPDPTPDLRTDPTPDAEDFEALFEDAPCGFLCVSSGWRIVRSNATFAQWTGHDAGALAGQPFTDLLDIAGKIYVGTHFAPILRLQGAFDEVALNVVRADGSKMPVLVNARERRDGAGALRMVLVSVFNATDRRRYESELLEARNALTRANETLESRVAEAVAERMRAEETLAHAHRLEAIGNLSAGVAHDFNNLLQVVGGNLHLLRKHVAGAGGLERIDRAAGAVERGARLAGQLLAFGRKQKVDARVHDIGALVRTLSDTLIGAVGRDVGVRVAIDDAGGGAVAAQTAGRLAARVDGALLENAIINLAVNGRDAMRDGNGDAHGMATGSLTLKVEARRTEAPAHGTAAGTVPPGDWVVVSVADEGPGMAPDTARRAFEPFFTTKETGKGTGLGLSMVHGFVTQSGGHVTIDSTTGVAGAHAVGRGTTVRLWLPRSAGAVDGAAVTLAAPPRGDERVLVVEDDDAVRDATGALLSDLGYEVLLAPDGARALALLGSQRDAGRPVDLVVSDVVMPGRERGAALAGLVREHHPDTALLFVTGYADAVARDALHRAGHAILRKPFTLATLALAARRALGDGSGAGNSQQPRMGDPVAASAASPTPPAPRATPEAIPETTREVVATPPTAGPTRVLLVEDDVLIRLDTAEMLEGMGCAVVEAGGVGEATGHLRTGRFDLLMTDIGLQDGSGVDLAREARTLDAALRIVFVTGLDVVEEAEALRADVLRKPFTTEALRRASMDVASRTG